LAETSRPVTTTEILHFILSQKVDSDPSWLNGLTITPALRYEVAGFTSSPDGDYATGGDYAITLGATYDFKEQNEELDRLNREKERLIQDVVKKLNTIEVLRERRRYEQNDLEQNEALLLIIQERVNRGRESQKVLWDMREQVRKSRMDLAQTEIDLKSERFLFSMLVEKQRESLLALLERWNGFAE
jgi:hypothetical protein